MCSVMMDYGLGHIVLDLAYLQPSLSGADQPAFKLIHPHSLPATSFPDVGKGTG